MSNARKISASIRKLSSLAQKSNAENKILRELFVERYGIDYSDVDCDFLIDCADYGQGAPMKIKALDKDMLDKGYPVLAGDI